MQGRLNETQRFMPFGRARLRKQVVLRYLDGRLEGTAGARRQLAQRRPGMKPCSGRIRMIVGSLARMPMRRSLCRIRRWPRDG